MCQKACVFSHWGLCRGSLSAEVWFCGETVAVMSEPHLNRGIRRGSEWGVSQTRKHKSIIRGPTNTSHDTH